MILGARGDVVHLGGLVQAERVIALGDDSRAADHGVVDEDGIGQDEDPEVGSVIGARHGIERGRDVVHRVAGRQLRLAQGQDELLELQ